MGEYTELHEVPIEPKLSQALQTFGVQGSINCYQGVHGDLDWSKFTRDISGFNIEAWQGNIIGKEVDDQSHLVYRFKFKNYDGLVGVACIPELGGKTLVIMNEGSSNKDGKIDWKFNFDSGAIDVYKVDTDPHDLIVPYGNVDSKIHMHNGFVTVYSFGQVFIRTICLWAREMGYAIFICGHSLGGAMTTVSWADLHYMFNDELKVNSDSFLFGVACASPRVGNGYFTDSFNKRSRWDPVKKYSPNFISICFGHDTVANVPTVYMGRRSWKDWLPGRFDTKMGFNHPASYKQYLTWVQVVNAPVARFTEIITVGMLPPWAFWDHDPVPLLDATMGKFPRPPRLDWRKK